MKTRGAQHGPSPGRLVRVRHARPVGRPGEHVDHALVVRSVHRLQRLEAVRGRPSVEELPGLPRLVELGLPGRNLKERRGALPRQVGLVDSLVLQRRHARLVLRGVLFLRADRKQGGGGQALSGGSPGDLVGG